MRTVSKIFLIVAGFFGLLALLSSIASIVFMWLSFLYTAGMNITIIVLMNSGSAPDVLSFLLMFATYTSPFKLLLDWLGSMGMVDLSNEMLQIYFIFEIVISLVDAIATTVSMMIPFILGIVTVVIAFKGAGKKAKKGSHIVCIVFGVISYLYINTMLGILMLVGGIFGVIADGKDAKKLEEARRKQKIKALPYYKKA